MSRNIYKMSADASNYDSQNVECQSLIPISKILSRSPRFAKRAITSISDVFKRRLCLQQPAPACGLTHGCVTMLSDSQGLRTFPIRSHSIVTSQWTGILHSQYIQLRMRLEQ